MDQTPTILAHLKKYKKITPMEAWEEYKCMRLSARIYDIKKLGYDIDRELKTTPNKKRYAEYYLLEKENGL